MFHFPNIFVHRWYFFLAWTFIQNSAHNILRIPFFFLVSTNSNIKHQNGFIWLGKWKTSVSFFSCYQTVILRYYSGTWLKRYDTDSPLCVLLIASANIMEMSITWGKERKRTINIHWYTPCSGESIIREQEIERRGILEMF